MAVLRSLVATVCSLFRRRQREAELDEELCSYLDFAVEQNLAAGMPNAEARRAARVELGSPAAVKDRVRDVGWESSIERLWLDVRYAVRVLWRSPGFTVVAVVTLGLGIGAATAIYSVVDTILVQPLPFAGADRLVRVVENVPSPVAGVPPVQRGILYSDLPEWRSQVRTLTDTFAVAVNFARIVKTQDGLARLWSAM